MIKRTRKKIKRKAKVLSLKYFWPILPTLALVTLSLSLGKAKIFNLRKITCYLDDHPCSLAFEPVLVAFTHKNIFKLKNSEIVESIKNLDPSIDEVRIKKHLPNTISINLTQRIPIAQLNSVKDLNFEALNSTASATFSGQFTQEFLHLDPNGEIFNTSSERILHLPTVLVPQEMNLSLGTTDISRNLSKIIKAITNYYVSFDLIALINPSTVIVKTTPGSYAILETFNHIDSKVASLQYILSNIKIKETVPIKIDLRFDKPVLTY